MIGQLSKKERLQRIIKYKTKLIRRRAQVPIIKKFSGRSLAAATKIRVNGKFVKKSDL